MCRSSATLFYGTSGKTFLLFLAADAWPQVKPVFLALDLIAMRKRKGTLRWHKEVSDKTATIAHLPAEIWELALSELFAAFGLVKPRDGIISCRGETSNILDALTAIAIPVRSTLSGAFPSVSTE
ncbi:hypothetical protein JCM11641_001463 [Rhodosporidiobolus odoratus]